MLVRTSPKGDFVKCNAEALKDADALFAVDAAGAMNDACTIEVKLQACNESGAGEMSDPLKIDLPSKMPSKVENLKATGESPTSMEVVWEEPKSSGRAPLTGYVVRRRKKGDKKWKDVKETKTCACDLKDLEPNCQIEVQVVAKSSLGEGEATVLNAATKIGTYYFKSIVFT